MSKSDAVKRVTVLPGDGVGPEVIRGARRVLEAVASQRSVTLEFEEAQIGGCAIDDTGTSLPPETIAACERTDAILLGAVGGPKWSDPTASARPEQGLLELRRHFGLFANLRPIPVFEGLIEFAPLRSELLVDVDILFVRELTGGLYFGDRLEQGSGTHAFDTLSYKVSEVERVAHVAFQAAAGRRRKVTSVDKANVLASMRLWRRVVERVAAEYPDIEVEHVLVDACAMHLMRSPSSFDVVLAGNLFGDILSDEASVLAGSLGMLPSASLGEGTFGLFEPVHGSAPDIAGRGVANPIGAILSVAMMLRYSMGLEDAADDVERAVSLALDEGVRSADLVAPGSASASTEEVTEAIVERLA